jgi:hypothetical protein
MSSLVRSLRTVEGRVADMECVPDGRDFTDQGRKTQVEVVGWTCEFQLTSEVLSWIESRCFPI